MVTVEARAAKSIRPTRQSSLTPKWVAIAFVGAIGVCLPAWHVVSELLSDSYMTLYAGRWIAQHGIPHREVFTVAAASHQWIDQQWLAELVDYEAWRVGGYGAVALLTAGAIGVAYAMLAAVVLRRGVSLVLTVSCCAIALIIALPSLFIRAQELVLPLFVLLLGLCLSDSEHALPRRRLALTVPLLVLWANLHGSVLLAAGLVSAYLLYRGIAMSRRGLRKQAAAYFSLAVVCALTPLATPYGPHIVTYYRELIGNPGVASAAPEDRPPGLSDPTSWLFFLPLALTVIVVVRTRLRRQHLPAPLVVAAFATAVATIVASRNAVWFGITAAVLLGYAANSWLPSEPPRDGFLRGMAVAAASICALGIALLAGRGAASYETLTPLKALSAAAAYAGTHPGLRILADNAASSALLWHYPSLAGRVGYDARLERYSETSLDKWIVYQTGAGSQWPGTTDGYQLLIGSSIYDPALVRRLANMPGTSILGRDGRGIAVVKN
jgi:hypothetical protein